MDSTTMKELQGEYQAAVNDVVRAYEELVSEGRQDRADGLMVGADLGTSAAFLFSLGEQAHRDAIAVLREAIRHARREGD